MNKQRVISDLSGVVHKLQRLNLSKREMFDKLVADGWAAGAVIKVLKLST